MKRLPEDDNSQPGILAVSTLGMTQAWSSHRFAFLYATIEPLSSGHGAAQAAAVDDWLRSEVVFVLQVKIVSVRT